MQLIAYVTFPGNCAEALEFYKNALGGTIIQSSRMGDSPMTVPDHLKDKIMHARLQIGESVLYMSDNFDPSQLQKGNNISLSLQPDDLETNDKLFNNMAEGGKVIRLLEDTFWGARFGMLVDKFGINWMFNCELKKS